MKEIYIVLTHTGTTLSKVIKYFTKAEFSHISISLDKNLNKMYSFGRLHPYNPFWGGFVHEYINSGTFKRFTNTNAFVFAIEIEEESYEIIRNTIEKMDKNSSSYSFNVLGLFAVALKKKIQFNNSFYCAEFVKYILEKAKVNISLPEIIKPEDFIKIENTKKIYKGKLKEYYV